MCGIVGIWRRDKIIAAEALDFARDTMRHRGPDGAGSTIWAEVGIGLGHRRLAIIDLTAAGKQPLTTADGSLAITFNGEIYNYQELRAELLGRGHIFNSHTDTEVILLGYKEWGTGIAAKLNGMFAFAIADKRTGQMFLARDRAGEKPLFYYWDGEQFIFSSELKGMLAFEGVTRKINIDSFNAYLAYGYVPGGECIVRNTYKLPAGHCLEFHNGRIDVKAYWSVYDVLGSQVEPTSTDEELVDRLQELLTNSVKRQLMSDVPLGVLLSGGVDSSLITALAAKVGTSRIKTFTVSFPGHGRYDEAKHARLIADAFGTEHCELEGTAVTPDIVEKLAVQYDEPTADSSMIPTFLLSGLVRKHCTVALGGDGGDELFGGYGHYPRILAVRELARRTPQIVKSLAGFVAKRLPTGIRGRNYLMVLSALASGNLPFAATQFDYTARKRILTPEMWHQMNDHLQPENSRHTLSARFDSDLRSLTGTDFLTYLPDDILVKVDRASMLNSLEIRAPFLDYRIIEFAFGSVPDRLKVMDNQKKIILKKLARRLLPREFDIERKQGFSIPLSKWLRSSWKAEFIEYLSLLPNTVFDQKAVQALAKDQGVGRFNSERVFALALFALWMKAYRMTF